MSTLQDRFTKFISPEALTGFWLWTGYTNPAGYGQINTGKRAELSHRVSWKLAHGQMDENLCVLHHCDTPACCNPAHLFLGTRDENHKDMQKKNRQKYGEYNKIKTHCKRGHPLSGENLYYSPGKNLRNCRKCKSLLTMNAYYLKKEKRNV